MEESTPAALTSGYVRKTPSRFAAPPYHDSTLQPNAACNARRQLKSYTQGHGEKLDIRRPFSRQDCPFLHHSSSRIAFSCTVSWVNQFPDQENRQVDLWTSGRRVGRELAKRSRPCSRISIANGPGKPLIGHPDC